MRKLILVVLALSLILAIGAIACKPTVKPEQIISQDPAVGAKPTQEKAGAEIKVLRIYPSDDAFVAPTELNYGKMPVLQLARGQTPDGYTNYFIYFKFDNTLSKGLKIEKVVLKFCVVTSVGDVEAILAEIPDSSWTEENIFWDTAPDFGAQIWDGDLFLGWVEIDVTKAYLKFARKNYFSLGLWPAEFRRNFMAHIASKEFTDPSLMPYLEIHYK